MHVNGPDNLGDLHIPAGRMSIEMVILHLISEWGVSSNSTDWEHYLRDAHDDFVDRRAAH